MLKALQKVLQSGRTIREAYEKLKRTQRQQENVPVEDEVVLAYSRTLEDGTDS